jgi:hypothetical protein
MQIAEQIVKGGTTGSSQFCDALYDLIIEQGITKVIETGTHKGTGTTAAIIKGLQAFGNPFEFYSIEVNPKLHAAAIIHTGELQGVTLLNGLSVDKSMIPVSSTFDVPDFVIVDHFPENRDELYRKEVAFNVPDNMLEFALKNLDYRPHLVVLDSAGSMGYIELMYLLERAKGGYLLALDDTSHVKHYDSMLHIKNQPEKFEIMWEVESEYLNPQSGSKFGSAIIKVK